MSQSDRAEGMARLRRVVAQIKGEAGPAGERAARRLSLTRAFDSALVGGLADDALHEIAPAEPADGAAAMGFALALAARFLSERQASALIDRRGASRPMRRARFCMGRALSAHGLPLSRLVFVEAPDADAAFWAMEEALKSGGPAAVVGEIWNLRGYSLAASRRLLLAARKGRTPALLVLASAYGQAERMSSAAETRFEIAALPSARIPALVAAWLAFACAWSSVQRLALQIAGRRPGRRRRADDLRGRPLALSERGYRRSMRRESCVSNGETGTWLLTTRRFLSLWLPRRATDRARRLHGVDKAAPLAATARVNNAERLSCVDAAAARLGLKPGLSLADARARHPSLVAFPAEPMDEARPARGPMRLGLPLYAPLRRALDGRDGLMLDISGVAHLFGGETAVAADFPPSRASPRQEFPPPLGDRRQSARRLGAGAFFRAMQNRAPEDLERQGLRETLSRPAARRA